MNNEIDYMVEYPHWFNAYMSSEGKITFEQYVKRRLAEND